MTGEEFFTRQLFEAEDAKDTALKNLEVAMAAYSRAKRLYVAAQKAFDRMEKAQADGPKDCVVVPAQPGPQD